MSKVQKYVNYCTGCGLCHSVEKTKYEIVNGFYVPKIKEDNLTFFEQICPASGKHLKKIERSKPWGDYIQYYCTWSTNENIRHSASSGGTITTILTYLLSQKIVDKVIQVGRSMTDVTETQVYISESVSDVQKKVGSRYASSFPMTELLKMIGDDCTYAFVGKPCDVIALKNYMNINSNIAKKIILTISFFCAGIPSKEANEELLKRLETDSKGCQKLDYRGNGWPGFATAIDKNGVEKRMTYDESWGKILGRDINRYCRFCMDGVGTFADISCGDAWYMTEDFKPDFSEHDGRNITFARTAIGQNIIEGCIKEGYLTNSNYDIHELKYVQHYQYSRRQQVYNRLLGLKICHKIYPYYRLKELKQFSKGLSIAKRLRITIGTIQRVAEGKM